MLRLGTEAGILTASALGAGLFGAIRYGLSSPQGRTMAFGSLASAQLLHALTYRSGQRRSKTAGAERRVVKIAKPTGSKLVKGPAEFGEICSAESDEK